MAPRPQGIPLGSMSHGVSRRRCRTGCPAARGADGTSVRGHVRRSALGRIGGRSFEIAQPFEWAVARGRRAPARNMCDGKYFSFRNKYISKTTPT